jgi:hypothetical protein
MSVREMTRGSLAMTAPEFDMQALREGPGKGIQCHLCQGYGHIAHNHRVMVLLTVGPIVHPHHKVDLTSRRSGKLTSSTVSATLPMGLTMLPESLCLLTILMMPIVLPRMLLLFWILFKPATRTT